MLGFIYMLKEIVVGHVSALTLEFETTWKGNRQTSKPLLVFALQWLQMDFANRHQQAASPVHVLAPYVWI